MIPGFDPFSRKGYHMDNTIKDKTLEILHKLDTEISLLTHIAAVLNWDQETYMPPNAIGERSEQLALLEGIIHQKSTNPEIKDLLESLGADETHPSGTQELTEIERAFVREVHKMYIRSTRLPEALVVDLTRAASMGQAQWAEARQKSDFTLFAPALTKIVDLTRQKAECLGYNESIYDPLLDVYEPWMKTSELDSIFNKLIPQQKQIIDKILGSGKQKASKILEKDFNVKKQEEFGYFILKKMGFSLDSGRLDVSAHPFSTSLGQHDVRLTTRYNKNFFNTALFGVIHEGGHGLYEMGFSDAIARSILANGVSLGIHESQSRFWENLIGRSLPFWEAFYPELKKYFPEVLQGVNLKDFYGAINHVELSLTRVEADEATYNLHIILRYRLEKQLLSGDLAVKDLPAAWRAASRELFGLEPRTDAEGVLQDIHWSMGAIGYFPTYALGNLYSAQFYQAMKKALPNVENEIRQGNLLVVLDWLRKNIHCHGSVYPAGDLCERVTGERLNPDYFIRYLSQKFDQ
jgi:carboxypeptidase Taq